MKKFNPIIYYNKAHAKKIIAKKWRYIEIPKDVDIIYNHFKPKTVLDIGAGDGLFEKSFINLGCKTFAIDFNKWNKDKLKEYSTESLVYDVSKKLDLERKFDLVISIEMLEHIMPEDADIAVENICRHGDVLFITANPNSGKLHVNAQHISYWKKKFESNGFIYQKKETQEIVKQFEEINSIGWLRIYSCIFRKQI